MSASRYLPLTLLALTALEFRVPAAWACGCSQASTEWRFENEDAAYVAEVLSIGGVGGCSSTVELKVTEVFKGVEEGEVITRPVHVGRGGGDCSVRMEFDVGEKWLFYGRDSTLAMCSGYRPASEAEDELDTLRTLSVE